MRDKFVSFWRRKEDYKSAPLNSSTVISTVTNLFLFFILPWIRRQAKKPFEKIDLAPTSMMESFLMTTNPVIRLAQLYFLSRAFSNIFGSQLHKVCSFRKMTPRLNSLLKFVLGVATVLVVFLSVVSVTIVLTHETNKVVTMGKRFV